MLAEILLDRIACGELSPGDRVPSIAELATAYTVAPNTVRGALAILAEADLIESHQGHGTFISQGAA